MSSSLGLIEFCFLFRPSGGPQYGKTSKKHVYLTLRVFIVHASILNEIKDPESQTRRAGGSESRSHPQIGGGLRLILQFYETHQKGKTCTWQALYLLIQRAVGDKRRSFGLP